MQKFEEKKFNIGKLKGISEKTIEEHLKLYGGYVKHANLIMSMIEQYGQVDDAGGQYSLSEITRRFSFEYNGMRNHEVYFDSLSDVPKSLDKNSELTKKLVETFGSVETFVMRLKNIAMIRGIGWAILWYDKKDDRLLASWIDEQHIGQLSDCAPILALDMWEHSFVADYQPSGKKQYIEDFFENLNWEKVEKNFEEAK